MLFAAQLALGRGVPLLGINRGRLGFLTDVSPDEIARLKSDFGEVYAALDTLRILRLGFSLT